MNYARALFATLLIALISIGANATSVTTTGAGKAGCEPSPFSVTYIGSNSDATNLSTYTWASQSFGPDPDCSADTVYLLVSVGGGGNTTVSSVTIGGVGATLAVTNGAAGNYYVPRIAGSGTITFSLNATVATGSYSLYQIVNPGSITPSATATSNTTGGPTPNLNIPSGGAAIGVCVGLSGAGGTSAFTWTGLTERFEFSDAQSNAVSYASGGAAGTPHNVLCSDTSINPSLSRGAASSWGP